MDAENPVDGSIKTFRYDHKQPAPNLTRTNSPIAIRDLYAT
jgi:hypothetical protein